MPTNGIMEEIRNLMSRGKSSNEVIALGYKPPTVYKVQRQLRQKHQQNGKAPVQVMDQTQSFPARDGLGDLSAADAEFFRRLFGPVDEPDQPTDLPAELHRARDCIVELEKELLNLRDRVLALEAVANSVREFKHCDPPLPVARQSNNRCTGNSRPNAWDVAGAINQSRSNTVKG